MSKRIRLSTALLGLIIPAASTLGDCPPSNQRIVVEYWKSYADVNPALTEYYSNNSSLSLVKPTQIGSDTDCFVKIYTNETIDNDVRCFNREDTNLGRIDVTNSVPSGNTVHIDITTEPGDSQLAYYSINNWGGLRQEASGVTVKVKARIYGNLTGNITNSTGGVVNSVDFYTAGKINSGATIKAINIAAARAHIIEGGVTIESASGSGAAITAVGTGYSEDELNGVLGTWPAQASMDVGTSSSNVTIKTPSGVNVSGIQSVDDAYLTIDVGGNLASVKTGLYSTNTYYSTTGTRSRILRLTGSTATLGNIYALNTFDGSSGGYVDTGGGSNKFTVTSTTTEFGERIEAVESGSSPNEVDLRGRIWFARGIGASAVVRLKNAFTGEIVFNTSADQIALWNSSSSILVNGTDLNAPDYALVPSAGGTIGFVDNASVATDGFYLHDEACDPLSNAGNDISLASDLMGGDGISLQFYGPIKAASGASAALVKIEWHAENGDWVTLYSCPPGGAASLIVYTFTNSGAGTGNNILNIKVNPETECTFPFGAYRIIRNPGKLECDLGLGANPDVQDFGPYYFNLVE